LIREFTIYTKVITFPNEESSLINWNEIPFSFKTGKKQEKNDKDSFLKSII